MPLPSPTFIRFEDRLKEMMALAEKETGFTFPTLHKLVRSETGVLAAKRLLVPRERFSEGFKRLFKAGHVQYTVEAVVLEFKNTSLFTPDEIETAEWRLANADRAS